MSGDWLEIALDRQPDAQLYVRTGQDSYGRTVITGVQLIAADGAALTSDQVNGIPLGAIETSLNRAAADDPTQLPALRRAPDATAEAFAALVATHYRAWARRTPRPVAAIADAAGVKPHTVGNWVREARLRGFLPPARRRKHSTPHRTTRGAP